MSNTILFDLDGTIVNTNELIIESYLHTLHDRKEELGINREYISKTVGLPLKEQLQEYTGETNVETYIQKYRNFNEANHNRLVKAFPGTIETFQELKKRRIQIGVVTSKIRKTALMGLEVAKVLSYIDTLVAEEDVENKKPAPDPLKQALSQFSKKPFKPLMVGDSHFDILAAKAAYIDAVAVKWSQKSEAFLRSYSPQYFIDHISDLIALVNEPIS